MGDDHQPDDDARDEDPKPRSKIFGPHVQLVDPTNYINGIYDAPDEEWVRWRISADGKTRLRF